MTTAGRRTSGDSGLVLRILTAILLSGGSLLAVADGDPGLRTLPFTAGLSLLWGALALEAVRPGRWWTRGRLDALMLVIDLIAVGLVIVGAPELPGLVVYCLGPVATAAVRLGREGATAAAALAALGLLLPGVLGAGGSAPLPPGTALGAVVLLAAGLAAGELVRIAERRRDREAAAERRARRTGHEVQMILDNLGSGLLTVDAAGTVTRLNPLAGTILGRDPSRNVGRDLRQVLGADGEDLADLIHAALQEGRPRRRAEITVRRERRDVPLGVNVVFLTAADGAIEGAVVVFNDLTEVRRLQEHLRRADRLAGVGELAANIAHELRNPLASIRGSVELLASDLEVADHHAQLMQLILRESGRLNTIITEFLAFARMRPGAPRPVPADRFLADVQLQLQQHVTAQDAGVQVECEGAGGEVILQADPEQLLQAVLNLGINACEAMHGSGELHLHARAVDGACELTVSDTGPGIEPERMEEIFTPFVTTKPQGTGLGLPMVARIVHGHGGTVEARNNPAGGAEFVLRLPLASERPAAIAAPPAPVEEPVLAAH